MTENYAQRDKAITFVPESQIVGKAGYAVVPGGSPQQASGYVKALQHVMMGGRYQSADLNEMDYAAIARTMGCGGIRVEDPEALAPALQQGMEERDRPTVVDVVVTRDPAQMLPAVDNRTLQIKHGDRVA